MSGDEEGSGSEDHRYRTLVDNFPNGAVFLYDEDLRFTLAGGAELNHLDISPDDVVGKTLKEFFDEDVHERQAPHYRAAFDGEERVWEDEYDGEHYRIHTLPIHGDDGEVVCGMAFSQNVTAQHEYASALERQNNRLAEFASIVSHDLRNPLSVAVSGLELARETGDGEDFERVERAHERMRTIIDDLLRLARQGEAVGETEPVPLADVARTAWNSVDTGPATLAVAVTDTVVADRGRLQQLFENLFRNCVEHAGEHVTVTVGEFDDAGDDGDGPGGDDVVGFYVADDGPGIPAEVHDRVFETGYSTTTAGTGFGLNIVRAIAEAHGWTVDVGASESGGARFEVRGVRTP